MAGRILSDLGAEVVKVESTQGDPLRRVGPFDEQGASLRFVAWNAGEVVVAINGPGDPRLERLVAGADVILTTPGWPEVVKVEPDAAPNAIFVAVTPFGLGGPRADWKASDLGVMAATGNLYATGDPDRPPVRCCEPVAWVHVGAETAVAALTALASGRPQVVDVSAQEAVMIASMGYAGSFPRRQDPGRRSGANIGPTREIWRCRDGFVSFGLRGGKARVPSLVALAELVAAEGLSTQALDRDWATFDHRALPPEELRAISEPIAAYFARHTLAELYEVACERNLMLAPVNSPKELVGSRQLAEREFFGTLGPFKHFPRSFLRQVAPDGQAGRRAPGTLPPSLDEARRVEAPHWPAKPRANEAASPIAKGAWSDTKLVEFGTGAAGPIGLRYFAEHGATVVRVESRGRPDFLRTYGLADPKNPCGLDGSDLFDALNVGKLSITVDLRHPDGLAIAHRLVRWADAVAENFAPRVLASFGLDYASLSAEMPDLLMVSSCLQGQSGPHRHYPGFGGQGAALSGFNFLTGWPDREPVGPFGTITDSLAPRFLAAALAAGLLYRRRTGRGLHLDVSQVEAAVYSLSPWILDYVRCGRIRARQGNRSERFVPHGVFPAVGLDRWVAIACWDDEAWKRLAEIMGLEAPVIRRLATLEDRIAEVEEVETLVARWTAARPAEEVAELLQGRGVEAVPVADFADAYKDPQLRARGHYVSLEHPCLGPSSYERNGFRLSDEDAGYVRPSPLLGQHTEYVLGELLGLGASERQRLQTSGALS